MVEERSRARRRPSRPPPAVFPPPPPAPSAPLPPVPPALTSSFMSLRPWLCPFLKTYRPRSSGGSCGGTRGKGGGGGRCAAVGCWTVPLWAGGGATARGAVHRSKPQRAHLDLPASMQDAGDDAVEVFHGAQAWVASQTQVSEP